MGQFGSRCRLIHFLKTKAHRFLPGGRVHSALLDFLLFLWNFGSCLFRLISGLIGLADMFFQPGILTLGIGKLETGIVLLNEFEAKSTALRYCRKVYEAGFSPICPRLMYEGLLRDEIPQEHKDRIEMASELLRRSRILVVCGDSMDGQVKDDIGLAKRLRIAATTLDGIMKVDGSAGKRA